MDHSHNPNTNTNTMSRNEVTPSDTLDVASNRADMGGSESFQLHGGGTLVCDNCLGKCIDKAFLGNFIRPLFVGGDAEHIKEGLIAFVTSAGVVSALLIGISSPQAFSVEAYDWMSTLNVICWYISTWTSMWSVVISTILG